MFLRKLLSSNDAKPKASVEPKATSPPGIPPGLQTMGAQLQRRFAKGVQYNMKIIIKGDRNVGKTCLFHRLQGQKFKEEYIPTDEIQVASIQWNYKATDDVVKVEVWDVVDKGKKKKLEGLKLADSDGRSSLTKSNDKSPKDLISISDSVPDPCLDAEFIDVYKGTHGVIMVMDITKQWTFDYIERELPKVPPHIPVLLLANHRDMGHHRTVTEDKVRYYLEDLDRPKDAAEIRYAEASMRNGFGLKYLHKFFNLPFLQLQRETLLQQLETNKKEMEAVIEELGIHEESEEQNYDIFLENLTTKRREQQDKLSEKAIAEAKKKDEENAKQAAQQNGIDTKPVNTSPTGVREAPPARPIPGLQLTTPAPPVTATPSSASQPSSGTTTPSAIPSPTTTSANTPSTTPTVEKPAGFMSRLFGSKNKKGEQEKEEEKEPEVAEVAVPISKMHPVRSVEDFVPEEGLDASFLDDAKDVKPSQGVIPGEELSDSEDEGGNPLVAGFQDDLDSEDETPVNNATVNAEIVDLSSEGEEDTVLPATVIKTDSDPEQSILKPTKTDSSSSRTQNVITSLQTDAIRKSSSDSGKGADSPIESSIPHMVATKPVPVLSVTKSSAPTTSENEDDDEDEGERVIVLGDADISDEDVEGSKPTISQTTDSGLATDEAPAENEENQTPTEPKTWGLEFEDLSILEKGLSSTASLGRVSSISSDMATSSRPETDTDHDSVTSKKKKKHKNKDKEKDPDKSSKKKKKHKDKERSKEEDDSKEKKKKRKSKKRQEEKENADLEAFLGGTGEVTSPSGGGYESL